MRYVTRVIFWLYVAFLTFVLLVYNPFEFAPDGTEALVEKGFGLGLDPHVMTFLLLAVLAWACRWRRAWLVAVLLVAYAVVTEFLQPLTGRFLDKVDIFHNLLGLACGSAGWFIAVGVRGRMKRRK